MPSSIANCNNSCKNGRVGSKKGDENDLDATDIKEEPPDSEDCSNEGSSNGFGEIRSTPINGVSWPSAAWEDGSRRSAFHPYKPTVLTNLQRGNMKTNDLLTVVNGYEASWFENAGRGNITKAIIKERPINEVDKNGLSALMWSAAYGQTPTVQALIQNGAAVNLKGNGMETALHLAAAGGHHDIIKILVANGADVNGEDEDGNTPLLYAVFGDHSHAVDELLHSGADLFMANNEGVKPYNLAVEKNCAEARLVLENYIQDFLLEKNETRYFLTYNYLIK